MLLEKICLDRPLRAAKELGPDGTRNEIWFSSVKAIVE